MSSEKTNSVDRDLQNGPSVTRRLTLSAISGSGSNSCGCHVRLSERRLLKMQTPSKFNDFSDVSSVHPQGSQTQLSDKCVVATARPFAANRYGVFTRGPMSGWLGRARGRCNPYLGKLDTQRPQSQHGQHETTPDG